MTATLEDLQGGLGERGGVNTPSSPPPPSCWGAPSAKPPSQRSSLMRWSRQPSGAQSRGRRQEWTWVRGRKRELSSSCQAWRGSIHIRKKPTSQQTSLPTRSCRGCPTCVDLFIPTKQEAHSPWGGSAGKQTMVGRWGGVGHCLKYFEKKNKTTKSLAGFCYHHVPAVLNNVSDKNTPM